MPKTKKPAVTRTSRTDQILHLKHNYTGKLDSPKRYNKVFAQVLRAMADAVEQVHDAWADPEVVVWMHEGGTITAELPLAAS